MEYAAPGIRLSLHGRNAERLDVIAEKTRERGAIPLSHVGDVADATALAAWMRACDAQQPIELVIANAGISAGSGGTLETEEQSRAIFATNLAGLLNTIHPALNLMIGHGRGQIALMSSLASFRGFPGAPVYCAAKAAVRIYGEALRGNLAARGIEVNVICPGFIATPMTAVNPFPMPFIMCADHAARVIQKGLAQNRARIAFPSPMYFGSGSLLPCLRCFWTG